MPFENGKRYEIIDGELYVSKAPTAQHQIVCSRIVFGLGATGVGVTMVAPGLIFAEDEDVMPDLVWVSKARLAAILESDGHLHAAPELVVEVLSPGPANERRDRESKLNLYSRQGVREYWIADWPRAEMYVYRHVGGALVLVATLVPGDRLESPLLPNLALDIGELFSDLP